MGKTLAIIAMTMLALWFLVTGGLSLIGGIIGGIFGLVFGLIGTVIGVIVGVVGAVLGIFAPIILLLLLVGAVSFLVKAVF